MGTNPPGRAAAIGAGDHGRHPDVHRLLNRLGDAFGFIGGGGLGDYIFIGLNLYQPEYIIAGAVPVTILAIVIDYILSKTEDKVTPQGLKGMKEVS